MDNKNNFEEDRNKSSFRGRIEEIVTNGLGYDGVDIEHRHTFNHLMGGGILVYDNEIDVRLALAKMEGYKFPVQTKEVMEKLGFKLFETYNVEDPSLLFKISEFKRQGKKFYVPQVGDESPKRELYVKD